MNSVHVDFTNERIKHKPLYINLQAIPYVNIAKYQNMMLEAKLRWKLVMKKNRKDFKLKYEKAYHFMFRDSALSYIRSSYVPTLS